MKKEFSSKLIVCLLLASGSTLTTFAQDAKMAAVDSPVTGNSFNGVTWALAIGIIFAVALLSYTLGRFSTLKENGSAAPATNGWLSTLKQKFFTPPIPIEHEENHLLEHDYDGIRELDNSLPPWWKYGFYASIVFAVVYLLIYQVFKTGPNPEQEYKTEMAVAAKQMDEYRKKAGDMVDEKTVTMADSKGIEAGAKIFQTTCFACHGAKGEGGVGPNLTDKFWLHGGTINEVFKTIKYGVPEKGMQSWEKTYSPSDIKNIASFIKSIGGTNPPNAKAPQGEPFEEKATAPTAAKDSIIVAKK